MSYEYFLNVKELAGEFDPGTAFFRFLRSSPHAFYQSDTEILLKELLDEKHSHFDVRVVRASDCFVLQVNRRCDLLYALFSNALQNALYCIHEEDDDREVPLSEVFRQR